MTHKPPTIRRARPQDLPSIYTIEKASFPDPYPPSFLDTLFHTNPESFLVAEADGKVVGYVITVKRGKSLGHLVSTAIHPQERRRGIGEALIQEMLKILRKVGMTEVRLEVRKSNAAARRLYEKLGFEYAYTVESYYGDEDGLVYFKSL